MQYDRGITTLHPWGRGMCNRSPAAILPEDTVRNAVNVDFGNDNRIHRRKKPASIYSGVDVKGGYSCPAGEFFIEGTVLKKLNNDDTATSLYTGIYGTEFTYDYLHNTVYFSDGLISIKIVAGVVSSWGLPVPSTPGLYYTSGVLDAGVYIAAVCWVDSDGVESGASKFTTITLAENNGIVFGQLPQSSTGNPASLRLYLSTSNGKSLYHVTDVTPGTSSYSVASKGYDNGMVLESMFISPAPPCRIIRHYNGRILTADSTGYVWYTEPMEFDHFKLSNNFLLFPNKIDIMEPVRDGIFFAHGDKTEFYAGDFEAGFQVVPLATYGGVYGTGNAVLNVNGVPEQVYWQSQYGTVLGASGGAIKNLVEGLVAPETADSGAAIVREEDGIVQFVVSLADPVTSKRASKEFIASEIVRKGA